MTARQAHCPPRDPIALTNAYFGANSTFVVQCGYAALLVSITRFPCALAAVVARSTSVAVPQGTSIGIGLVTVIACAAFTYAGSWLIGSIWAPVI